MKKNIEKEFSKRNVNLNKLIKWLQLPKQGIVSEVAMLAIEEVGKELADGIENYKNAEEFPERFRKRMREEVFPEDFWLDNYVLLRAIKLQNKLKKNATPKIIKEPYPDTDMEAVKRWIAWQCVLTVFLTAAVIWTFLM